VNTRGRSLELFFIDGRPDGMLTAEVFNWTGHVLRAPRTQLKEALARREARYTGAYLLLGEEDGRPRVYIGEAEDMRERLRSHAINKDWWDSVVLITSAADALHKAHVKYLESRLVEIARDVGAVDLENGNTPTRSSLSEAATSNMESFIETLMMVLPAIQVEGFDRKTRQISETRDAELSAPEEAPEFTYSRPNLGFYAHAILLGNDFIVLSGSTLSPEFRSENKTDRWARLHRSLIAEKAIVVRENKAEFSGDYAFPSARDAAKVIVGRSNSSKTHWIHTKTGQTYADWEQSQLTEDTE